MIGKHTYLRLPERPLYRYPKSLPYKPYTRPFLRPRVLAPQRFSSATEHRKSALPFEQELVGVFGLSLTYFRCCHSNIHGVFSAIREIAPASVSKCECCLVPLDDCIETQSRALRCRWSRRLLPAHPDNASAPDYRGQ